MVLEVLFPSTVELDKFIGELQRFGRTKTLIVFSTSVEHRGIPANPNEIVREWSFFVRESKIIIVSKKH